MGRQQMSETGVRTVIEIDGRDFSLRAEQDLEAVMERIETAARTKPTFVALGGEGEETHVLISPCTRVVISVERIGFSRPVPEVPEGPFLDWEL